MARYFQHIDQTDENFQSVTELEMIDNSDPTFIMYYFKDGSKCSKAFIGNVNDSEEIFGSKVFAEITSPGNKWEFRQKNLTENVQYAVTPDGRRVEVADRYMIDHQGDEGTPKYYVSRTPNKIPNYVPEPDEQYYVMNMDMQSMMNLQPSETTDPYGYSPDTNVVDEAIVSEMPQQQTQSQQRETFLNADKLILYNENIKFVFAGTEYVLPASEFFDKVMATPKVVEKEVIKEVVKEVAVNTENCNEHLKIDLDDNQKMLIDNMIDMSQKEKCDIDMEITLSLPPISVYKIIKQAYPAGMAKAFVNTIADRMQIFELKSSVAGGLLAYYDEDAAIEVAHENIEEAVCEDTTNEHAVVTEKVPENKIKTEKAVKAKEAKTEKKAEIKKGRPKKEDK